CREQAPAEQLAVLAHGRAARARGQHPAGDGRERGLPRGGGRARPEAPGALRRSLGGSWRCSSSPPSSAYRPGLNRIPAALGHVIPSTLAFFTPQSGGSPNANEIDSLYKITLVVALVIFFAVEGALVYALVKF